MTTTPKPEPISHKNLALALAAFQAELPTVAKSNTARIPGKEGKSGYSYDYADLTDISAVVLPVLAKHGLAWFTGVTQRDNQIVLEWALLHGESDTQMFGFVPVGRPGEQWQSLGSSITYARRYALVSATGVAPGGDDNDGEGARAGADPERRVAPNGGTAIPRASGDLPAGLYDLSALTTKDAVLAVWRTAKAAGHLPLLVAVPDANGTIESVEFGQYLIALGNSFGPTPEEAEAAAVAAHEAEQAALDNEAGA